MNGQNTMTDAGTSSPERAVTPPVAVRGSARVLGAPGASRTMGALEAWRKLVRSLRGLTVACAVLFPFIGLFSSSVVNAQSVPPGSGATRIMVYGDSLSAAYGIKPEEGWVALMAQALNAPPAATKNNANSESSGTRVGMVAVINASISGETTRGGLSRIRADLAARKPTHVVLALGANDGLRGLPLKDTRANLVAMLDAIRAANARAILVGIQIPPNYGVDYARDFRDLYPVLARERKLPLVPFLLEGIADSLDWFQADRLHPTAAAQPRILQNVLPVVRAALSSAPRAPARTGATAP